MKAGYKPTEVGEIPDDWDVKTIRSIAEVYGGGTPSTAVTDYWHGLIPWVAAGDVSRANGRYIHDTLDYITDLGLASCPARIMPTGTTIIIARGATVGRIAQLGNAMAFNQTCYCLLPVNEYDRDFLYYAMLFSVGSIRALTYGTTFGTITTNSFDQWKIPVPPTLTEQRAIAAALSDVDALLTALDALIAKKRLIKQGAMQELLTGKIRLEGFSIGWTVKKLGDLAKIVMGQSPSSIYYNISGDGLPLIQGNADISNRGTTVRVFTKHITRRGYTGDILMTVRAPVGEVSRALFDVCLGRGVCGIRYPNDFLYYALIARESSWKNLSKGSTFDAVNSKDVKAFEIEIPEDDTEQIAIAEFLKNMDAEIAALEQRREKTRLLKQGMMQELLTGKTRLIRG